MDFQFKESSEPIKYTMALSTMLSPSSGNVAIEHLLFGPYAFEEFNQAHVASLLKLISPTNML